MDDNIQLKLQGVSYTLKRGVSLGEFVRQNNLDPGTHNLIMAFISKGALLGLDFLPDKNMDIVPVTLAQDMGMEIYKRSASFLLVCSFKKTFPGGRVYIGHSLEDAYSKEFCGGPHVKNTSEIGKIEIYKFEKIGSNLYRIYAK